MIYGLWRKFSKLIPPPLHPRSDPFCINVFPLDKGLWNRFLCVFVRGRLVMDALCIFSVASMTVRRWWSFSVNLEPTWMRGTASCGRHYMLLPPVVMFISVNTLLISKYDPVITRCCHLWSANTRCCHLWPVNTCCSHLWPVNTRCCHLWPVNTRCCHLLWCTFL